MSLTKGASPAEILRILSEKRKALKLFRFGMAGSRIKNVKEGKTLRREIAALLTAIRDRELKKLDDEQ